MQFRTLLALSLAAIPISAQSAIAILGAPAVWQDTQGDDTDGTSASRALRGVYASGRRFNSFPHEGVACRGSAEEVAAWDKLRNERAQEFWFFGTQDESVLFVRTLMSDPDKPCSDPPKWKGEVFRGLRVAGSIRAFSVGKDGAMTPERPAEPSEREGAFASLTVETLMSRAGSPGTGGRVKPWIKMISGRKASCLGQTSLVYWNACWIQNKGGATGMLVYAQHGDDEGVEDGFEIEEVNPAAQIDRRLFDLNRQWRLR